SILCAPAPFKPSPVCFSWLWAYRFTCFGRNGRECRPRTTEGEIPYETIPCCRDEMQISTLSIYFCSEYRTVFMKRQQQMEYNNIETTNARTAHVRKSGTKQAWWHHFG